MRGKTDDTPKKFTKSNLPSKDCIVCNRPFEWRKKWERCWDEVKYCSERCRRDGKGSGKEDPSTRSSKDSSSGGSRMQFSFDDSIQYSSDIISSQNVSPYITNIFNTAASVVVPPVSLQQREMQTYQQNIRKAFSLAAALFAATAASSAVPSLALAAGTSRPSKEEILGMFLDGDWDTKASVLRKSSFRRLDETPDSLYYVNPRIVEHIDEKAVNALVSFHAKQLGDLSKKMYNEKRRLDILDICSSWTSHLPLSDYPAISSNSGVTDSDSNSDRNKADGSIRKNTNRVVGVGMNREELSRNVQLSESLVIDLNVNPKLPFEEGSFDAILLQLSIGASLVILFYLDTLYQFVQFVVFCDSPTYH